MRTLRVINCLVFFLLFSIVSCNRDNKIYVFQVPHDYDGLIYIVFGVEGNLSVPLQDVGNFLYSESTSTPFILIKNNLVKEYAENEILIKDAVTGKDLRLTGDFPRLSRINHLSLDTLIVGTQKYPYISGVVTALPKHEQDSVVKFFQSKNTKYIDSLSLILRSTQESPR